MIKCLIVEDEFPAREELKYFINTYEGFEILNEFDNPIDSLKFLENNKVDVIFLDINMPNIDGMSLGKIIHKMNKDIKLVFITAYREYAAEAFEIKAFDYLLKPYSETRINELLENLKNTFGNSNEVSEKISNSDFLNNKKITVNFDSKMVVISIKDILYIEADEKEVHIFTKDNSFTSKLKISQLENILPNNVFFRCHRSYIVNIDKIIEVEPWFSGTYILKVKYSDFKIPVSRNNVKQLKDILFIK